MRSPLKEVNGGSKALLTLKSLIPPGTIINSFGFFDGNVEVDLCANNRFVVAHTNKYVIYEFWRAIFEDAPKVAQMAETFDFKESDTIVSIITGNGLKDPDQAIKVSARPVIVDATYKAVSESIFSAH